ncbi:MAG: hypothetical protein WD598_11870 [Acidimicrobiia bacterium]
MSTTWARVKDSDFVRRDLRAAALPWVVARVLVLGSLWLSRFFDDRLVPRRHDGAPDLGLFIYDGSWYRDLAEHGYAAYPKEGLRFFPLFPLLGRWLGAVFGDHVGVALVVIVSVAALVLGALVHRLVLREIGDARVAVRAAWFVAVFPAALSFVLSYAEPLMMVAAVGMFLALRSGRWGPAAALGVAAGLTRPVGLVLMVPAAIEAARGWRECGRRERGTRLAAVASPAIGTAIYLAWVGIEYDDPLLPFSVQSRHDLRGGAVDPITHVVNSVGDLLDGDRFGAGLHLLWLALFLGLLVVLARRLPASYTAYGAVTLVLGMTASNISSFERYAFSTFVFAIAVALVTTRADVDRSVNALAAGGLVTYAALAFFRLYVP